MDKQITGTIAFLGAGSIAEAWIERFVASKAVGPQTVMATDIRPEPLDKLTARWDIRTSASNPEGATFGDIAILAVPPPVTLPVLREIAASLRAGQIVVSLAAAVPLAALKEAAGGRPVVRVMPNTPALVGEAMNLVAFGCGADAEVRARVIPLLDTLGVWREVADAEMDFWCALCAVGPTYILPLIDALASAASAHGLAPERALEAAAQMVAGTAEMVLRAGRTPEQLKQMIGLRTLDENAARTLFAAAYNDAVAKLQALGQKIAAAPVQT